MVSAHFPVRLPRLFPVGMMGLVAACAPTNSSTPMPETPATAAMQDAAQTPGAKSENPAAVTGPTQIVIYRGAGAIGLLATAKPKVKVDGTPVGQCRRKDKQGQDRGAGVAGNLPTCDADRHCRPHDRHRAGRPDDLCSVHPAAHRGAVAGPGAQAGGCGHGPETCQRNSGAAFSLTPRQGPRRPDRPFAMRSIAGGFRAGFPQFGAAPFSAADKPSMGCATELPEACLPPCLIRRSPTT